MYVQAHLEVSSVRTRALLFMAHRASEVTGISILAVVVVMEHMGIQTNKVHMQDLDTVA